MTAFMTHDYLKPFFDIVLLEHSGLPHVLPLAVHLFLAAKRSATSALVSLSVRPAVKTALLTVWADHAHL